MVGKAGITTSTNDAYGKVKTGGGAADEGYEMVYISPATPAKLEEMYEVPLSPNQPLPPPPLHDPPGPGPAFVEAEDEVVYDFIRGDQ